MSQPLPVSIRDREELTRFAVFIGKVSTGIDAHVAYGEVYGDTVFHDAAAETDALAAKASLVTK